MKKTQLAFWTAFKEYMEEHSDIRCQKPARQHWMNHSIGKSGFWLDSIASSWSSETQTWDPEIRVEFLTNAADAKKYFAILEAQKVEIEQEVGQSLIWSSQPDKRTSKIYLRKSANFLDPSEWPHQHEGLRENLEKFHRVFAPRVKRLDTKASNSLPTQDSADNLMND